MRRDPDAYDQRLEKRRRAARRARFFGEFFEFWVGVVLCRLAPLFAIPPLVAWYWLEKLGVSGDTFLFIVGGLASLMTVLFVWLLARLRRN